MRRPYRISQQINEEQRGPEERGGDVSRSSGKDFLVEVAWEVCNQVGGIYQVLRSKAPVMVERWGRRYCLIGPYVRDMAVSDFEPTRPAGWVARAIDELAEEGLVVHHGRWLVSGKPRVILIDCQIEEDDLNVLKHRLWEEQAIESDSGDELVDGAITFGFAVERLTRALFRNWVERDPARGTGKPRRMLIHCHEWLGGVVLPLLRNSGLPISRAFTTHATLLGRYIASSEESLYERLPTIDHEAEARHYHIWGQHQIERAAARDAHVFTTVSPVTGEECEYLLGRKPDLITPNGLNIERFDVGHDFQTLHAEYKASIQEFTMGHFFPSYAFDLDKTIYFFTSGRFEPSNKGFDLCLDAMARLNEELKKADLGVTVVFFIVSQRPVRSMNPDELRARGVLGELRSVSEHIAEELAEKLFQRGAAGEEIRLDDLLEEYWRLRFRRTQFELRSDHLPLTVTHILKNESEDPVVQKIQELGLENAEADPVKIVYHPEFINPVNPLWRIEYEQFVRGCHLGIFPSSYEPWGYTPLECVAMGVPAITSDLAGFGRYVQEMHPDHDAWGLGIIQRRGRTYQEASADLARRLLDFCRLSRRERIALRNAVEQRGRNFDWLRLGQAYNGAHELAFRRAES